MKEIMIPDCVKVELFGQVRPVGEGKQPCNKITQNNT